MSFAVEFAVRLMAAAPRIPQERKAKHAEWLLAQRAAGGGFRGRSDLPDLYYTAFGVRCALLLDCLDAAFLAEMLPFLRRESRGPLATADLASYLTIAFTAEFFAGVSIDDRSPEERAEWAASLLMPYRRPDGGWAKSPNSALSSTYHTFLALECLELADIAVPEPRQIAAMIRGRQASDGGFVDLPFLREGGTNPTAAALAVLYDLDALSDRTRQEACGFLHSMQRGDGGFAASGRAPCSDLLSTFTALVSLDFLDALDGSTAAAAQRYVSGLEHLEGGFRGVTLDDQRDAEYTFYGLAATAWLRR
ncbi:MAG: terpene cyclase/mutase family protein [Thermogutta sp.]|nr:terpene cyclase/mutase family protein [Thermogutta sp.]